MDAATRGLFAAQVIWTLANADVAGPYVLEIDQLPAVTEWLVLDGQALNGELSTQSSAPVTDEDRIAPIHSSHVAYVIYTSGSTGKPKGVSVTHGGLRGVRDAAQRRYEVEQSSRFLHICSPSFDPSVLEWMVAFSAGATLVIDHRTQSHPACTPGPAAVAEPALSPHRQRRVDRSGHR